MISGDSAELTFRFSKYPHFPEFTSITAHRDQTTETLLPSATNMILAI